MVSAQQSDAHEPPARTSASMLRVFGRRIRRQCPSPAAVGDPGRWQAKKVTTEITKAKAGVWIIATILAPLVLSIILSSFYIGIWYGTTQHQGNPPAHVIANGMWIGGPLALWGTILIWWFVHRKSTPFSQLFRTRSATSLPDLAIGLVLGGVWVALYGLMDVVAFGQMFELNVGKLVSTPASVSAGFCEEFLFRGFVFLVVARAGGPGQVPAALVNARLRTCARLLGAMGYALDDGLRFNLWSCGTLARKCVARSRGAHSSEPVHRAWTDPESIERGVCSVRRMPANQSPE